MSQLFHFLNFSFGAFQLVSTPVLPLSPPLSASLLTKSVLRAKEGEKGQRFEVRVLFHVRGDVGKGTCITLHAFKETEEQKASCITQVMFQVLLHLIYCVNSASNGLITV